MSNSGRGINPGASFESVRIIKPPAKEPDVVETDEVVEPESLVDTPVLPEDLAAPEIDPDDDLASPAWADETTGEPDTVQDSDGAKGEPVGPFLDVLDTAEIPAVPSDAPPAVTIEEVKRRKVIVIDDDVPDESALSTTENANADRVDPRIRARRREVQRAAGLRRFRVLIAIGTVLVLVVGGSILAQSSLFSVKVVNVTGVRYTDPAAVQEVADSLRGQPLYRADLGQAEETILLQPWVRRVHIIRTWPRTVTIDIAERTPVGAVQGDDTAWRVIDVEGRVLALTQNQPKDFIEIKGDPSSVAVGETVSEPMIAGARLAESLPGRLKAITTRVIVGGDGAVALNIQPKGTILLGTIDDLKGKLISVLTYMDACPGVQFDFMDAKAADALVITPPTCLKSPLTKKTP